MSEEPTAHIVDSRLYRDLYGTPAMRAVFSDRATIQAWFDAEAALAAAEAEAGLVPEEAALAIASAADAARIDLDALRAEIARTGHPFVPAIRALEHRAGAAGEFVHYGATTQDIMDTGAVLQMRRGLAHIADGLGRFEQALSRQARAHRETVMAGRTHGQHAVPVTLGLKLAVLVAETRRHAVRLGELKPRLFVGQLAGAAGTLATLADKASRVRAAMMRNLDLAEPPIVWHTARDAIAETVSLLAMIGATCGRFAGEVVNLQRSEIAEVAEPAGAGRVGSSIMPQKQNPMTAQDVVALARLLSQAPAQALSAMMPAHERDMAAWQMEWLVVPETFILGSGALHHAVHIAEGLVVDAGRMRRNLEAAGGFLNAEAVMMALAPALGRHAAHEAVAAVTKRALGEGLPFAEALAADEVVSCHLDRAAIDRLLEPESWLGEAVAATDRILDGG
jgi:3-carboxy-cis,cis-muconate cycloisomerase